MSTEQSSQHLAMPDLKQIVVDYPEFLHNEQTLILFHALKLKAKLIITYHYSYLYLEDDQHRTYELIPYPEYYKNTGNSKYISTNNSRIICSHADFDDAFHSADDKLTPGVQEIVASLVSRFRTALDVLSDEQFLVRDPSHPDAEPTSLSLAPFVRSHTETLDEQIFRLTLAGYFSEPDAIDNFYADLKSVNAWVKATTGTGIRYGEPTRTSSGIGLLTSLIKKNN